MLDIVLNFPTRRVVTATFSVEHYECIPVKADPVAKISRRIGSTSRIALQMSINRVSDGTDSETFATCQQFLHGLVHVLIRDEHEEILLLAPHRHPNTSEAKSRSTSAELRQSANRGCWCPAMMSVAPSSFLAKHKISFGSAQLRKTGE